VKYLAKFEQKNSDIRKKIDEPIEGSVSKWNVHIVEFNHNRNKFGNKVEYFTTKNVK